jgi:hypothetical protein
LLDDLIWPVRQVGLDVRDGDHFSCPSGLSTPHSTHASPDIDPGTWAVAADQGQGSQELHVVYASPGTITAYRTDGHFPDGTVLVKEVHFAVTGEMTTGTVSHADKLRGWFVMVKDSRGRYPGNNMWGDGWGWGWFDAANPSTPSRSLPLPGGGVAASLDYRENCKSCHLPAQATDWIYVVGYPPLRR